MSKFNKKTKVGSTQVANLAGGFGYKESPDLELMTILLNSFVQDTFYQKESDIHTSLAHLLTQVDPLFAAKAAIFSRTEMGMRSITHILAAQLASYASGTDWGTRFFTNVVRRVDDMSEILSLYRIYNIGKPMPNAMKRGFAKAFDKFDSHQLAKYQGKTKEISLVDIVNMVHPVPTPKNGPALYDIVRGKLTQKNTWESALSAAGKGGESFADAWADLIREDKLGYIAMIRNLNNITEQAPDMMHLVGERLVEPDRIGKSLVMPFQIATAIGHCENLSMKEACKTAMDVSCKNIPEFKGKTLVVLDVSLSMTQDHGRNKRPHKTASLFAAMLMKSDIDMDFMTFDNTAEYRHLKTYNAHVWDIAESIPFRGGGTNFSSIFDTAHRPYERIIILSDMHGWIEDDGMPLAFKNWKKRMGCDPIVYSFDLANYGTTKFHEDKVICIAGFSDKIFKFMQGVEEDKTTMVSRIKNMSL